MRFVSVGIGHESNTFAVGLTRLADFVAESGGDSTFPPSVIVAELSSTATVHGGALDAASALGVTLEPLFLARAGSGPIVEQRAYETLRTELLSRLTAALPVDGVLMDLHGAMITEQLDDAEGDLIAAVRRIVGLGVPIVVTLDLHANITPDMVRESTALIGFDTYPHCDMDKRGAEAVQLLCRLAAEGVEPAVAFRQLPLITLPPMQCTMREPMVSIMKYVHRVESEPGILTATLACGFPFADVYDAGMSVVVYADGSRSSAAGHADEICRQVLGRRDDFTPELTSVDEVIRYVREEARGPVVLADGSDNPGGGAPSDGTVILRALIDAQVSGAVVGVMADPQSVARAHTAGVGHTVDVVIGGKTDDRHGLPIRTKAYVRVLGDGEFTYRGPMGRGTRGHLGRMAVLVVDGVEVVVAERRAQLLDREMLRCVGIQAESRKLIVVKSAVHFWADFADMADRIFDADTPGVHRPDFRSYSYRKLRRPIYPLDHDVSVEATAKPL